MSNNLIALSLHFETHPIGPKEQSSVDFPIMETNNCITLILTSPSF
jgi:hypothetical protein